jgi:oligopeptide/dipeptide ABC transporter ATP-binding protein
MALLEVKNLQVDFETQRGLVTVLRDLNFEIEAGEAVGLVGESGSGKSVTSLAVLQLLSSNAKVSSGEVIFSGRDLLKLSENERAKVRGRQISMIFQDPMTSLNPCYTVGAQIEEVLKIHEGMSDTQAEARSLELLQMVGIPDPRPRLKNFPHELSGGMSQRVMIAMAMACRPQLLIADEPTTALDVTIQAQILGLLRQLRKDQEMSLVLVSHDLGVIAENTDRVLIMYAGEIVESGLTKDLIAQPKHPYTAGLLNCLPGHYLETDSNFRLPTIPGSVLNLQHRVRGCQFQDRCPRVQNVCRAQPIALESGRSRSWRCVNPL